MPNFRNFKSLNKWAIIMIEKQGLDQILHFVSKRWIDISREANNKAMNVLGEPFLAQLNGKPPSSLDA